MLHQKCCYCMRLYFPFIQFWLWHMRPFSCMVMVKRNNAWSVYKQVQLNYSNPFIHVIQSRPSVYLLWSPPSGKTFVDPIPIQYLCFVLKDQGLSLHTHLTIWRISMLFCDNLLLSAQGLGRELRFWGSISHTHTHKMRPIVYCQKWNLSEDNIIE